MAAFVHETVMALDFIVSGFFLFFCLTPFKTDARVCVCVHEA